MAVTVGPLLTAVGPAGPSAKGAPPKYFVYKDPGDGNIHGYNNRTGTTDYNLATTGQVVAALLTTIGGTPTTIAFSDDTHVFPANLTIPSNVGVIAVAGTLLSPSSGITLTINGVLTAGPYQIFGGAGTVAFGPGSYGAGVLPEWFGTGAVAFQAAITAAESTGQGQARVVCQAGKVYSIGAALTKKRSTIIDLNGAEIDSTLTSGALFTVASASDGEWAPGWLGNGRLVGAGSPGTSVGVQVGSGTQNAHNAALRDLTIKGFGQGVVFSDSVPGGTFLDLLDHVTVQSCVNDGVVFANAGAENIQLDHCNIFNNGNGTGAAGVAFTAGSGLEVHIVGGSCDNNGNGTVGQIHVPSTVGVVLYVDGLHAEWTGTGSGSAVPTLPHIDVQSAAANPSQVYLGNAYLLKAAGGTPLTVPLVRMVAGTLDIDASELLASDATGGLVTLGDGTNAVVAARVRSSHLSAPASATGTQYVTLASTVATAQMEGNVTADRTGTVNATYYATSGSPAHTWIDTSAGGVVLHLVGNGGTTPGKYLTVNGGNLEVRGDSFGTVLLRVAETVLQTAMPIQPQMGGGSIYGGTGVPTISAGKGSIFLRSDGAVGSTFYVCQGGTTWNAVASV